MMAAQFASGGAKLRHVELSLDVMSFMQQLRRSTGKDVFQVSLSCNMAVHWTCSFGFSWESDVNKWYILSHLACFLQVIPNTAFPLDVAQDLTNPTYNIQDTNTNTATYNNTNNTDTNTSTSANNSGAYPTYAPTYASIVLPNNTILNNNHIVQNHHNTTYPTNSTLSSTNPNSTTYTTSGTVPVPAATTTTFSREGAMENFLGTSEARAVVGAAEPFLLLFTNQVCVKHVLNY